MMSEKLKGYSPSCFICPFSVILDGIEPDADPKLSRIQEALEAELSCSMMMPLLPDPMFDTIGMFWSTIMSSYCSSFGA